MKKLLLLALLMICLVSSPAARTKTVVKGIRHASYKNHTRIVVDLNGPVKYSQNRLPDPDRIYFDLKDSTLSRNAKTPVPVSDSVLKQVRLAQFNRRTVRMVLDINEMKNFYAFTLKKPHRLVVDVYSTDSSKNPSQVKKELPVAEKGLERVETIVIDPGHGGDDPGAIGPSGLREKDIVLHVSKRLGAILEGRYNIEIIYTRKKDVFIPLNERTELANSKDADLFISIHTNASRRRTTKGIETYFLNWTNNTDAMRVAARENKITMKKMKNMQDSVRVILQDLARDNKRKESMRLAYSVQNAMVNSLDKSYSGIEDLGVKYALFYVLVGAEMPSILAEISFISNHREEKRLASASYRQSIAESIAKGIDSYITESTLIVNPVVKSSSEG